MRKGQVYRQARTRSARSLTPCKHPKFAEAPLERVAHKRRFFAVLYLKNMRSRADAVKAAVVVEQRETE